MSSSLTNLNQIIRSIEDLKVIIADGVRKQVRGYLGPIFLWIDDIDDILQPDKRFVIVSSVGLAIQWPVDFCQFDMQSWTIEEYKSACAHEKLLGSIKNNLLKEGEILTNEGVESSAVVISPDGGKSPFTLNQCQTIKLQPKVKDC